MNKFKTMLEDIEIIRGVKKHGTHDQKTHGSWANTLIGDQTLLGTTVTSIIDKLSEKDTPGFSIDMRTKTSPKDGFIASDSGAERSLDWAKASSSRENLRNEIVKYVLDHAELLDGAGAFFGGWVDKGVLYFDVSRRYASRSEGVRAGFQNEQKAIYDVVEDSYIYMEDEVDERTNKARSGGSSEASQGNDPTGSGSPRRRDGGSPTGQRVNPPHVCLGRYQGVEKHLEGQHDQATHGSWASGRYGPDSVKSARDGAKEYAFKVGIKQDDSIDYQTTVANRARAVRIADAYDELPVDDPKAYKAYTALATEVEAQFDYMTKTMGIKVEFVDEDPYKTSREMFADVSKGTLKVLRTASTGSHPFFTDDQNDKFRAVHDFFGHAATGRGFGQDGEESAWVHHSQMFTETARAALTTETRGQNSWYNTRGKGFAEQKVALLPKEFWEVPKTFEKQYKVIRFAPGLIPVLKHQEHDQSTHGSWADGYTPEERARMETMAEVGPSIEDLEAILNGGGAQPDYDELKMLVENDHGLYTDAIDGIEERIAARIEENPDADYNTVYDEEQEKMIDEFIENSGPGYLAGLWMDQNGGDTDSLLSDVKPSFEEIFNTDHTVVNAAGDGVTTLSSKVQYVEMTNDTPSGEQGILVIGDVKDSNGNYAGEFKRVFYKEDGVWLVEHKLLKLDDDYKGLGFGKEFIDRSEDWYTQRGFGAILVGTGWDGARVWARDGFDWQPESIQEDFEHIIDEKLQSYNYLEEFQYGKPARIEFDALMERATNGYVSDENGMNWDSIKDLKNDDFPLPQDFVSIGYKDRTTSDYEHPITGDTKKAVTWAGERLFANLNLNYVKILTPEGRNLFEGPVDRDGDGLVYDGTAREKPASAVKS
jgi:GNAT superfamily N-acetyltransferase